MSEKSQSGDDTSTTEMVGNETRQAKLPKLDAAETGSLKSEKKAKGKSSVAKANEEVDASTTKSRIIAAAVCLVVCAAAVIVGGVLKSSRKSSDNINAAVILDTDWEAPTSSPVMLRAMSSRAPSPMGKTDRDEVVAPLISGRVTLAPSPNASPDDPSNAPFSLTPSIESLEDSREPKCPLGTKAVTIDYVEQSDSYIPPSLATDSDNQQYTLSVKNACYGNVVARCLPCPMKGVASPAWSLNKNVRTRRVDETVFENNDYASTTICIPDMQEYHLEVAPIPSYSDISPCCGLTSNLAPRVTYDGVIVAEGERDAYFGDKEGGCQSQLPSAAPTERPSASPSGYLSSPPSSTPTSSAPTKSPLAFAGPCLEEFVLLSYYSVGTRISRGGFIYECMRVSCGSYGHDPGSSTSNLWRQSWTIVGTCTGTFKPTIDPSRSPTDDPTRMPTSNPTRLPTPRPITPSPTPGRPAGNPTPRPTPECTTERDLPFNMCLAFDMSGSVCNDGTSSDCDQSGPRLRSRHLLRKFWKSERVWSAHDCGALDGFFEAQKEFSVVKFSTRAQIVRYLNPAEQTIAAIESLDYTGGTTNHQAAIEMCQETLLLDGDSGRKNFIMMITDGISTFSSGSDPSQDAQDAARQAEREGTFIVPVFIRKDVNDIISKEFMSSLSTDGAVFDVSNFSSLTNLRDILVEQVSCSEAQK